MKKILALTLGGLLMASTLNASAWWGDDDYWDDNDWPVFTPMYWMEEFFDIWDDDYDDYYWGAPGYYGTPYAYGYGAPYYGPAPYYGGYAPYYGVPSYQPPVPASAPAETNTASAQ